MSPLQRSYQNELDQMRTRYGYVRVAVAGADWRWDAGAKVPEVKRARMRKLMNYIGRAEDGRNTAVPMLETAAPSRERYRCRFAKTDPFGRPNQLLKFRNHGTHQLQHRGDYVC